MVINKINIVSILFLLFALIAPELSFAQGNDVVKGHKVGTEIEKAKRGGFSVDKMPSMFFTYWQYRSIIDAKNSQGVVRAPTQSELDAIENGEGFEADMGPRNITLGGIVFTKEDDWTIWINGQRVTPTAVPKEVLDLRVFKDYIEIKWLDEYTNQVFPVRIRSNQRFNLDSRIFLPG